MTERTMPKFLTIRELYQVAVHLNKDAVQPTPEIVGEARVTRPDFHRFVLAFAGTVDTSGEEKRLAKELDKLSSEVAAMWKMSPPDFKAIDEKQREQRAVAQRKVGLSDVVIDNAILELFGETRYHHNTHPMEWAQEKAATKEFLDELDLGFEADTLVLIPVLEAVEPFREEEIGLVAIAAPENGDKKVLHVLATLPAEEKDSTFYKRVAAMVGKEAATNGVNSVRPFTQLQDWKIQFERGE